MKLQQLRYLCQIVDSGFNVTEAAKALHTSQSGISRQVRLLEDELGSEILTREGNRISGLTEPGEEIVAASRRLLSDARNLRDIAEAFVTRDSGSLVVAMFHLHARYSLQPTIAAFHRKYPKVRLQLSQLDSADIAQVVASKEADIGLMTSQHRADRELVKLAAYDTSMHLYTPRNHPLSKAKRPTLQEVARYPLILLDPRLSSGRAVSGAFDREEIAPNVVMTATNTDVIKAHVAAGLGVAFLRRVPLQPREDGALRTVPVDHLFAPATAYIVFRRDRRLRTYMYDFIEMINPRWTRERVEAEIARQ